jgi:hypothetical protein
MHVQRHAEIENDQMPGQDSFLDVITNIVGILILLVMIVGVRSSQARRYGSIEQTAEHPSSEKLIHEAYASAQNTERNVSKLIQQVISTRREALIREQERLLLNTIVADAEQKVAEQRAQLSSEERRDFDVRRQLAEAQFMLDGLTREQVALLSREPDVEVIECQPTPFARTVTGKELHVLLADDHVAVVPFEELLEQMKADVQENIWRLRQQDELERAVGPIGGFRLRYWFIKADVIARSEAGTMRAGQIPQFSHCFFLPVHTPAGEPAAEAVLPNSELRQYLQRHNPQGTTVTIWTYPGNFDRLREVKREIRRLGYQIAVRPLPKGVPIGASRTGTESVTE